MNASSAELTTPSSRDIEPMLIALIDPRGEDPLRAELLGLEGLEAHAARLGAACVLAPARRARSPLLRRFVQNTQVLSQVHRQLVAVVDRHRLPGIDAEWLVDNFHIIADSLREVRHDLPPGYDELLPKLAVPGLIGYPRVYALALTLAAHCDSELDEARIARFVQAFQQIVPLTIGELWALPTMLRLVLIENLRRLAERMIWGREERRRAERWAADVLARSLRTEADGAVTEPAAPNASLPDFGRLSDPFVVRLIQLLRDQEGAVDVLDHLEAGLAVRDSDLNEVLRREQHTQAANQVTVGNCVLSLRLLSAVDWNAFFEESSRVDAILVGDPSGVYPQQDFATSDRYRRAVETISRGSDASEIEVARRAIELAGQNLGSRPEADSDARSDERRGHVGYYLVDRGRAELEAEFGYRPGYRERLFRRLLENPESIYFGAIAVVLGALVALAVRAALGPATATLWLIPVVAALLLPLSELAVGLVNHLLTLLLPPRVLPKLAFKAGIPAEHATFIVIPGMLTSSSSAVALAERLETHYLSNPDSSLRFALLTDFADAPHETMPEDDEVVREALERIRGLNDRYRGAEEGARAKVKLETETGGASQQASAADRFFLFHRRRLWNPAQGCWMGWERKRGKLLEFNGLLRGARDTSYSVMSADPSSLPRIRYVITLDADTRMPRDTAGRLVGAIAHALNRPTFEPATGRVVAGYGVLQPRISFFLTASTRSRFAALLATSGGIDPYSTAASDAYMDLFGVGTFTGKGIYDVDAFEAATGDAFPQNQILSHDLIEGNYARCGLLSDTELFDDFPARYNAYARREHRWVRGDWQLLPWLGLRVPIASGRGASGQVRATRRPPRRRNPLPVLERWKLLDNLRRSLVPPALLVLLVLGWTVLPGSVGLWTAAALTVSALPLIQTALSVVVGVIRSRSLAPLRKLKESAPPVVGQVLMEILFLAYRSALLIDAIGRTLARLLVTRRKLLEWETAASTEQRLGTELAVFIKGMWSGPVLAVVIGALVGLIRPHALAVASPFLIAWFASPWAACVLSQPGAVAQRVLTGGERRALRRIARKTWLFFETFVGDADHWLPPDNFQEVPDGRVAHRTSPTNQGLLLLSTLAANDLGYIGPCRMVERLEKTLDTLNRLDRHWGHFYNWYQTQTLQPLPPKYISTVDSGNLLGCLIALAHGLNEKAEEPLVRPAILLGLSDTFDLAAESATAPKESLGRLAEVLDSSPPADLPDSDAWLEAFERAARELAAGSQAQSRAESPPAATTWANRLVEQASAWRAELQALAPWLGTLREQESRGGPRFRTADAAQRWSSIRAELVAAVSLSAIVERADRLAAELAALEADAAEPAEIEDLREIATGVRDGRPGELLARLRRLADTARALAGGMDFRPLYRPERHLFAIGYNLAHGRLDNACYDLLASEACLTSYLAVARGEAPRRHWFQLGRPFIQAGGRIGLISWGGTMFEYLMPRLLLRSLPGTLLSEACRTAVDRQIEYGRELGLPWGISESGFAAQYLDGDYQYQAFGTPGLGLKQGLEQDRVIAPYATAMATMLAPHEALENFQHLSKEGAEGEFGYYEAIDYTPERLPKGKRSVVVRSYMAHHQGMSLVALDNALHGDVMTHRFSAEPMVHAIDLLLEERVPSDAPLVETNMVDGTTAPGSTEAPSDDTSTSVDSGSAPMSRRLTTPFTPVPRTHILSNTQYHVLLTNAGSGVSTCRGLDMTRWREDAAREAYGQFAYVRDVARGAVWSAGFQPVCRTPETYEVIFAADKATFRRRDLGIDTVLEVVVSPEHRAEIRRITLINHDVVPRELELTSYAEIVLAPRALDLGHPAFAKLFLETEWLPGAEAIVCRRRMRSASEQPLWAVHISAVDHSSHGSATLGEIQYETDRARFLGRGRTVANPAALEPGTVLSGTVGPVLDPMVSLRRRLRIEPGGTAVVALTTAFAESRDEAIALADQFREAGAVARAFDLAWAHILVEHRHHDRSGQDARLYQRLASHIIFAGGALRAEPSVLLRNGLGQPDLWRFGVSGDRAIALVRIAESAELPLARQLLAAHEYLRLRGLEFDLVLLDEEAGSYLDELHRQLLEAVRAAGLAEQVDRAAGIFVRKASQMSEDERVLLQAAARVVLVGERGPLASQLDRTERHATLPGRLTATREPGGWSTAPVALPPDLVFNNGLGGFTPDGREYCVLVQGSRPPDSDRNGPSGHHQRAAASPHLRLPPAPWVNVVANPNFGFVASEAGSGFTWAVNSQSNRLTPWSNDPVSDPPGEVVYLRDEDTGEVWSPTPLPVPSWQPTLVRHGQGYTVYERNTHGLTHKLTLFVPPQDPVKLISLKVKGSANDRPRRLSATFYAEWVLGLNRDAAAMHVVTEVDAGTGALLARNAFRSGGSKRVAFADVDRRPRTVTANRLTFVGRHGSLAAPAAMSRLNLAEQVGAGIDPCAAIRVHFDLRPGAEAEVVFLIGEADDADTARALVRRYREPGRVAQTLSDVKAGWDERLGAVQVRTPDRALDLLANRWLLYQVLACRFWARSGFYQSGGAYGFRDQLQDVMGLVHAAPEITRAHILHAASHQFLEGDVQHWWHPPTGRGIRTRISDDPAWLPFVAGYYIDVTGDTSILDEPVDYLSAPLLKPGQEDDYSLPVPAGQPGPLYEHCVRSLDRVYQLGAHNLPLMGHGDWNDGMNRVGAGGKGESVWLAWFAIAVFRRFAGLAQGRGDSTRAADLRKRADALAAACETNAWDGAWYRRAYFDDGTPLGSAQDAACRIDSLSQTWAVLCGAADPERSRQAMEAVDAQLVDRQARLILLFTPPFDAEPIDPGYIKGYLPGIRENGGQYTHAAVWVVQAFAALRRGRLASELLTILNPIRHAADPLAVETYKVEPYVVAGDVYSRPPHAGRGGWTWYTGSASWLYRTILEAILGLHRHGDRLTIDPSIPPEWRGYEITYRFRSATYRIAVENPKGLEAGSTTVWVDGHAQSEPVIPLADDGQRHDVRVQIT
jgi:cyclic beta-1,2-glucan synthetase